MPDFIFDLPLLITGPAIVLLLCLYGVLGLLITRRCVLPRLRTDVQDFEFSGAMLQAVMVFYGLAVALIAVSVWQSYSDGAKIISQEATALAVLYRDVSNYPKPIRPQLQKGLSDYVDQIIHHAWPLQERGQTPTQGVVLMNHFQDILGGFEPATEGQKILHAETLRAYNQVIQARRLRLDAVNTSLPMILWFIIIAGAFISLTSAFFFKVEDVRLQGIQVVLVAAFIGLVIFMILALDRPFRGDLGLRPGAYQLIYDQLMRPSPP
jgi:hypothetical protein